MESTMYVRRKFKLVSTLEGTFLRGLVWDGDLLNDRDGDDK
jgi:hypothetical protein